MSNTNQLDTAIQTEIDEGRLAGCALLIRRQSDLLYQNEWGYADIENATPTRQNTIFRLMSMTKPVIAAAAMMLVEEGKLSLEDKLEKFYPGFANLQVVADPSYQSPEKIEEIIKSKGHIALKDVPLVPAIRSVTVRELLSHSSGLGMGTLGNRIATDLFNADDTVQKRVHKFEEKLCADAQPGEVSQYSPFVAFDIMVGIIELVSKRSIQEFLELRLFGPLGMKDTCFHLKTAEQRNRLAKLYKLVDSRLIDVTGDPSEDTNWFAGINYCSGGGGLYGTVADYDRFVQMLNAGGKFENVQYLKPETVQQMHTHAQFRKFNPLPGAEWGLGMLTWEDTSKMRKGSPNGIFGWSGAFGTHFFIDPNTGLQGVVGMNRSNIDGMGNFTKINVKIEELVFSIWK